MAKIKVMGVNELIEVSDQEALTLREKKKFLSNRDDEVTVGSYTGRLGDIRAVLVNEPKEAKPTEFEQRLADYYRDRNSFLQLSPAEKAKQRAWGHFSMFFLALKSENPPISLKAKVQQAAERFYAKNPYWSQPSLKLWYEVMRIKEDARMRNAVGFRILERVESNELKALPYGTKYQSIKSRT